jgi:hypothetical protein
MKLNQIEMMKAYYAHWLELAVGLGLAQLSGLANSA